MKIRKLVWIMTVTVLTLVLAACGGNAPAPTAESGAPSANTLSKQAIFDGGILGGGFSVQYPDSWSHQIGESDIRLSNDTDILSLDSEPTDLSTGTIAMSVSLTPASDIQGFDVTSLVQTFVDLAQSSSPPPEFGDIETITLDGRNAAKAIGTVAGSDNMLLAVDLDGNIVLTIIIAPEGELSGHMDTINAIVASVQLSPAE